MSVASVLIVVALGVLGLSLLLVLVRFVRGPSALDRLVALDAIVAVIMCGLMAQVALTRDSAIVPTIVAVSLVGFLGSSTVARFVGRRNEGKTAQQSPDRHRPEERLVTGVLDLVGARPAAARRPACAGGGDRPPAPARRPVPHARRDEAADHRASCSW